MIEDCNCLGIYSPFIFDKHLRVCYIDYGDVWVTFVTLAKEKILACGDFFFLVNYRRGSENPRPYGVVPEGPKYHHWHWGYHFRTTLKNRIRAIFLFDKPVCVTILGKEVRHARQ